MRSLIIWPCLEAGERSLKEWRRSDITACVRCVERRPLQVPWSSILTAEKGLSDRV